MKKSTKVILSRVIAAAMLTTSIFSNAYADDAVLADSAAEIVAANETATPDAVTDEVVAVEDGSSSENDVALAATATLPDELAKGEDYTLDFRDGSIVPTDTAGNTAITNGFVTIEPGTSNAFGYNGEQHGVAFKAGNTISLKVGGPTTVLIGGCTYSNDGSISIASADGTYTDERTYTKGEITCDGYIGFVYDGKAATTLTITFNNSTAYVPYIKLLGIAGGSTVDMLYVGGEAPSYEYNSVEAAGVDNSASRVSWSTVLTDAALPDGTTFDTINWTGGSDGWDLFNNGTVKGIWGDVDMDGDVTAADATLTLQYVLSPENVADVTFVAELAAVSGRGVAKIDSYDAALILQKSLDDAYKLPVEEQGINPPEVTTEATTEATTEGTTETTTEGEPVNVYVVGDSTACHYINTTDDAAYSAELNNLNDPYFWYKRVGFGDKLGDYLSSNATVINLALSGRSSKSFATGVNENGATDADAVANYAKLKSDIKAGDYLVIAWGHNDEKTDQYRYTDPNGSITDEGSFKKSLYDNYIKVAQDAGATPILCTPIIRANSSGTLSSNDIHQPSAGDYAQCIRDLGSELNITVIDSLANTKSLFETMTAAEAPANATIKYTINEDKTWTIDEYADPAGYFKMHAADQAGAADTTHLNEYGASMVAYMMARDIKASDNGLAAYVKGDIAEPTFDNSAIVNKDWRPFDESEYTKSTIWKLTGDWGGSAFGSGIGTINEDSHANHDIIENEAGKSVELIARNNKGKIASKEDGIVMYFKEINATDNFELTATAHVNSYDSSVNQIAFGLMLRDNVFTDYTYKTKTAYYAVGNTMQNSALDCVSVFSRLTAGTLSKDVLTTSEAPSSDLFAGKDIALKLTRKDGVVTVQYGDDAPFTFTGDIDTSKCNADKDYAGVFVSRAADITFNDINLTITE